MGNATAEGARNQLGRPDLEPLTVLVREAAQNSWDARLANTSVTFGITGWSLDGAQRACLKKNVFRHAPANIPFEKFLEKRPANVLAIHDRGTTGLTGPTRADEVSPSLPQREKNFVAFLRNIGQPRKADFGGGTYGYGKAVFYTASRLRTIIVHTRCTVDGSGESRLMAAALATPYEKYTGRHWWGLRGRRNVVDPVVGPRADELGSMLGMPSFARGETGTTILVLDPFLGEAGGEDPTERTPEQALAFMAASALWNFWPKMLADEGGQPSMKFKFCWDGRELGLPSPEDHPALHGFVTSMRNLRASESSAEMVPAVSEKTIPIRSLRPKKDLGILSLARFPSVPRAQRSDTLEIAIRTLAPYEHRCRHVALMRNPELIVRYEPGPENEIYEYAGVFKVDRDTEVDRAFADSEPPTHDDWEPNALEGRMGTYVRVALRRIREAVKDFALPAAAGVVQVPQMPLGSFSEMLGGLIASIDGTGAGVDGTDAGVNQREPTTPRVKTPGRGGSAAPVVEVVGSPQLIPYRKGRAVKVFFRVRPASGSAATVVTAVPRIAILDGSSFETESPLGEALPEVINWNLSSGESIDGRQECSIPAAEMGLHSVTLSLPGQTMVAVLLDGRAE